MGTVAPDRNYPTFSCSIEASVCFFFKVSPFPVWRIVSLIHVTVAPHPSASYSPKISPIILRLVHSFHPIERGPPKQFGVFSKWKRTLNFFGQRRGNNDSYNDPSFALDFDEEKRSLHFYEILHPLLPLSVSLPPCFILACTSQVTLAPCFLRARSVAAFCSAHRRGIPARQFIRKVFFAFSGALAADYTSPRSPAHGLPSVAVVWREATHLHTPETSPRCAKKTVSRVVAAHFRRSRWKYRTRIPVSWCVSASLKRCPPVTIHSSKEFPRKYHAGVVFLNIFLPRHISYWYYECPTDSFYFFGFPSMLIYSIVGRKISADRFCWDTEIRTRDLPPAGLLLVFQLS